MLRVEGLEVAYGTVTVLSGVDFEVGAGEVVALLGTNGAGKTTLLRAVSGVVPVRAGRVLLDGRDIGATRPRRRVDAGIVQVPGGRATFAGLTVDETLHLGARLVPKPQRAARLAEIHDRFGWLASRGSELAGRLSGGQQQILAIARTLLTRPRVLLVDELSLGLAPVVVAELLDVILDLRVDGTAVVLVEQQVDLALDVADRAYFLERGEVRFEGPAPALRGRTDLLRAVFLTGATPAPSEARQP